MNDWKIRPRSVECRACSALFSDGQVYHTLLFDERQEYCRVDVCQDCWDSQYGHGASDRKGFISHWQARFLLPPPPLPEPVKRETAESALRKLAELGGRRHRPACFILAAMLERKRVLKVRDQVIEAGSRRFVYEHVKSGDIFAVHDPELKLTELEAVQRDVAELLEGGVDAFLESRRVAEEEAGGGGEAAAAVEAKN